MDKSLLSIIFDAQTSGGLLLALEEDQVGEAVEILSNHNDLAVEIGRVNKSREDGKELLITS